MKKIKKEVKYWETKDGDYIKYSKIKDEHLLNILKWIERRALNGITKGYCDYEGDDDFMTGETWKVYGEEVKEEYDYNGLLEEAKKRKIIPKVTKK